MTCEEMIYSNDYTDATINYLQGYEEFEAVYDIGCLNLISDKFAILHLPRGENYLTNLNTIPYSFIPKLFGLMQNTNVEALGVPQVKSRLGLDGSSVIIGIIDTGIDYQNDVFKDENGESRIGVIWDQTIPGGGMQEGLPNPFYGTVFSKQEINQALNSEEPLDIVPSTDRNGHGTFLAGVAADENLANRADLAVVKLKEAKPYLREFYGIREDVPAYAETDIIYGIQYLLRYARQQQKPISILIGVGSSNGGHQGLTAVERYIDTILENVGIMISVPAGNEGNEGLHYQGEVTRRNRVTEVELNVDSGQNAFSLELWGENPGTFALGIVSPEGDRIEQILPAFGQEEEIYLPLAQTRIYVAYQLVEVFSGQEFIFVRIISPTPGIWRFLVSSNEEGSAIFHMWLPIRQFLQRDTYFLQGSPYRTITAPGNANLVMTMVAYDSQNGSIYAASGRGDDLDYVTKPNLATPGVDVEGAGLRDNIVTKSGTSIAAAYSAGVMALFLQWNINNYDLGLFYSKQIQSIFAKGAKRNTEMNYPNPVWGDGIMDLEGVFEQFRVVNYEG